MPGISAFLLQAALMLLVAYFLGAFIGCWLRRRVSGPPKVKMEADTGSAVAGTAASVAAGAAVIAGEGSSERFGRALDGSDQTAAEQSTPTQTSTKAPGGAMGDAAARSAAADRQSPASEPTAPAPSTAGEPSTPPAAESASPTPPTTEQARVFTPPMTAAAAAAAALAARQSARAEQATPAQAATAASVAAKMENIEPPPAPASPDLPASSGSGGQATVAAKIATNDAATSGQPDDLTKIDGVTPDDAAALAKAGHTTFAAIANWSAGDVRQMNGVIDGERRISRENWIEQAKLLEQHGDTAFTRRGRAGLAPRPAPLAASSTAASGSAGDPAPAPKIEIPPEADPIPDITTNAAPATPVTEEVATSVAQASVVAAAAATAAASLASATSTEPAAAAQTQAEPNVSSRAAFARERRHYGDDLQQIDGINAEIEKLLHEQGVTRISQIADWSPQEQQRIDRLLGGMNRVKRENWIGQARRIEGLPEADSRAADSDASSVNQLSSAVDAATSTVSSTATAGISAVTAAATSAVTAAGELIADPAPEDSPPASSAPESNVSPIGGAAAAGRNVRGLRSVRSEALVGPTTIDSENAGDDLKRIRGIGVLIEKRLRAMGFTSYEQIGSWTQSDVDRVNQQLDFRGRIERENWIEQARILAAGGQTDFSRRQERGEERGED